MTHYISWVLAFLLVVGLGYSWRHERSRHAQKKMIDLRNNRTAFLEEKRIKWPQYYTKHKKDDRLSDEDILARYMFVVVGEILGPPRYGGWSFQSFPEYPPQRDEILDVIAQDGPLKREQIYALAAKIDPEGEAALAQYSKFAP